MKKHFRYFSVEQRGDVTLITMTWRDFLNQLANVEMKVELMKFCQDEKPGRAVVDFDNVERFSTELIGTMLSVKKLLGEDGAIRLCGMDDLQRDVFRLLQLDGTVFQIHDTVDDALASLA
jgi:anti-anti-sigma regulatory factor